MNKPVIKEVLFCYLDILGYKKMVDDFFDGKDKIFSLEKKLNNSLSEFNIFINEHKENKFIKELAIEIISDTIIVKIDNINESVAYTNFFITVSRLIIALLNNHILVRGAIVVDKHYEKIIDNKHKITISNALIKSYKLESEEANYPRVIISQSVIDGIFKVKNEEIEKKIIEYILIDLSDGYKILNIFFCVAHDMLNTYEEHMKKLYNNVVGRPFEKHVYLIDMLNFLDIKHNGNSIKFKFVEIGVNKEALTT